MTSSSNIGATKFNIDASLELPADGYSAELDNCFCFINADFDLDIVELEAGLIDPLDQMGPPQSIKHLSGNVDEYILDITPNRIVGRLRGRDKVHELIDRPFNKLFLRTQPETDPDIDFQVGNFLASEIANEVVTATGLNLQFQMRDYELLQDFSAVGRSLDILTRLAEPFTLIDMFRVDIFVQDNTVFMRERKGSNLTPDYTFAAIDARIRRMVIRKKRTPIWGKVCLLGKLEPTDLDVSEVGGLTIIQSGTKEEVTTSETFDIDGTVISRTITTTTLRMPDRIPEEVVTEKFTGTGGELNLISEETQFFEYESSIYGLFGALNQPLLEREITETKNISEDDATGTFQLNEKIETSYGYDDSGLQTLKLDVTKKRDFDLDELVETRRKVETLKDLDFLKTERVTSIFEPFEETVILNPNAPPAEQETVTRTKFALKQQDTVVSAGLRPGGTRPPRTISLGGTDGADEASQTQIELKETISTDPLARNVTFSNENMNATDLEFIMQQFRTSSGILEYEIQIDYVAMAWLRKGSVLEVTGLLCEDGVTPIPLDPALIFEQRLNYDESRERAELVATLRAVFWSTT